MFIVAVFFACLFLDYSSENPRLPGPIREVATRQVIREFSGPQTLITESSQLTRVLVAKPVIKETITVTPSRNFVIKKSSKKIPAEPVKDPTPEFFKLKSSLDTKRKENTKNRIEKMLSKHDRFTKQNTDFRKQLKPASARQSTTEKQVLEEKTTFTELLKEIKTVNKNDQPTSIKSQDTIEHNIKDSSKVQVEHSSDISSVSDKHIFEKMEADVTIDDDKSKSHNITTTNLTRSKADSILTNTITEDIITEDCESSDTHFENEEKEEFVREVDEKSRLRMLKLINPSSPPLKKDYETYHENEDHGVKKALKLLTKKQKVISTPVKEYDVTASEETLSSDFPKHEDVREKIDVDEILSTFENRDRPVTPETSIERKERYKQSRKENMEKALEKRLSVVRIPKPAQKSLEKSDMVDANQFLPSDIAHLHVNNLDDFSAKGDQRKDLVGVTDMIEHEDHYVEFTNKKQEHIYAEVLDECTSEYARESIPSEIKSEAVPRSEDTNYNEPNHYLEPLKTGKLSGEFQSKDEEQIYSEISEVFDEVVSDGEDNNGVSDYLEPLKTRRLSGEFQSKEENTYSEIFEVFDEVVSDEVPSEYLKESIYDEIQSDLVPQTEKFVENSIPCSSDDTSEDEDFNDYLEPLNKRKVSGEFQTLQKKSTGGKEKRNTYLLRAQSGSFEKLKRSESEHDYTTLQLSSEDELNDIQEPTFICSYKNGIAPESQQKVRSKITKEDITWSLTSTRSLSSEGESDSEIEEKSIVPTQKNERFDFNSNSFKEYNNEKATNVQKAENLSLLAKHSQTTKQDRKEHENNAVVTVDESLHISNTEDDSQVYMVVAETMPKEKIEELMTLKYEADKSEKIEEVHMFDEVSVETKVTEVKTITMELSYLGDVSLQQVTEVHTDTDMKEFKRSVEKEQMVLTHTVSDKEAIEEASESSASEVSPLMSRKSYVDQSCGNPCLDRHYDMDSDHNRFLNSTALSEGEPVYLFTENKMSSDSIHDNILEKDSYSASSDGSRSTAYESETYFDKISDSQEHYDTSDAPSEGEPDLITTRPIHKSQTRQADTVRFKEGISIPSKEEPNPIWDTSLGELRSLHLDPSETETVASTDSFESTNVIASETDPDTLSLETMSSQTESTLRSDSPISQPLGLEDIPEEDTSDLQSSRSTRSSDRHIVDSTKIDDTLDMYIAVNPYEPDRDDVMSLHEGEKVDVLDKSATDWWFVKKYFDQRDGWVPGEYLRSKDEYDEQVITDILKEVDHLDIEADPCKIF